MQQAYEAPYLEIVRVASEKGFAHSGNMEDVGKDESVEF
jgi:hypothetical protein